MVMSDAQRKYLHAKFQAFETRDPIRIRSADQLKPGLTQKEDDKITSDVLKLLKTRDARERFDEDKVTTSQLKAARIEERRNIDRFNSRRMG